MTRQHRIHLWLGAAGLAGLCFFCFSLAQGAKLSERVYLKVEAVDVSSFGDSSGGWAPDPDPMAVADRDLDTRWASQPKDAQWVKLDFGQVNTIDQLVIRWERAFASSYAVDVSYEGVNWKRIFKNKKSNGGVEKAKFPPIKARYVRIAALKRFNPKWGVSIWELEPYGPKSENPDGIPLQGVFTGRVPKRQVVPPDFKAGPPIISPGPISPSEFQTGINYTSWHESDLAAPTSGRMLKSLYRLNVRHVALLTTWFQKDVKSKNIYPQSPLGGMTPTDEAIKHAINTAHALGLKVLLKPHLDIEDETYRGELRPVKGWFSSYRKFIVHYAKLAQKYNVEMFCVGTELKGATIWENEKFWRNLIKKVRRVYKGPLTYAANWDEYEQIGFWDDLDYIGIDAYFPLTDNYEAELSDITNAWKKRANEIEKWYKIKKHKQPIVFTEVGYPSVDGANVQPWSGISKTKDRKEQADCMWAAFRVMTKRKWFRGFYWWHYFPKERPMVEDLTLKGKLAEEVMSKWYKKINSKGERKR